VRSGRSGSLGLLHLAKPFVEDLTDALPSLGSMPAAFSITTSEYS